MMNILLIAPDMGIEESFGKSKSMNLIRNIIPPLGLAYIGAVLLDKKFNVEVVDMHIDYDLKKLENTIKEFKPEIIGVTSTSPEFKSTNELMKLTKKIDKKIFTVIGGSHVTALPIETLNEKNIDFGVIGEGEITFFELAKYLQNSKNDNDKKIKIDEINGLAYKNEKGEIFITNKRKFVENLDNIPFPAWNLLPSFTKYHPTEASYRKLPLAAVMTSRGCPSFCTFCDRSIFGSSYRERSAKNVLDEVKILKEEYGIKEIRFFDDTFTINKKRLQDICEGMKKLNIPWTCLTKANLVDEKILLMMKNSGCWQILFGVESGDEKILKKLGKGITIKENIKAIKLAHKAGLSVRADYLIGTPFDTKKSINKTFNFAKKLNTDFAHFNKFTPYPGTDLYSYLIKKGLEFDFKVAYSQQNHNKSGYSPKGISSKELGEIINTLHKNYYLRISYILRQLINIRSFTDIQRMIKGFIAIAFLK